MSIKLLVLGGGVFWDWGGECRLYFYGRADFSELNHVTVIADNSWEFLRGILSCNSILQEKKKETVTVMVMNSEDP